jgi:hypothetical protein
VRISIATDVSCQREAGTAAVLLNHAAEFRKSGHDVEMWFLEDVVDPDAWPKRLVALTFAVRVAKRIRKAPKKYDVVDLHAPAGCVYGISRRVLGSQGTPPYVFTMPGDPRALCTHDVVRTLQGASMAFWLEKQVMAQRVSSGCQHVGFWGNGC